MRFLVEARELSRLILALEQIYWCATARAGRRTYLVDYTSFVEVPVGLDAVGSLEIAVVAACFRRGALRCTETIEAVSFRARYADTVGEAVRKLWCQCWQWGSTGCESRGQFGECREQEGARVVEQGLREDAGLR